METNIGKELDSAKEIDLLDLGKKLWEKRKFILKASVLGAVIGIGIAFSIPKEYSTTVILAPEARSSSNTGSVSALAAMAGFNIGGADDAGISPELYPSIMHSTPFIVGIFNVRVNDIDNNIDTTLYAYLKDYEKRTWWSKIAGAPGAFIGFFLQTKTEENPNIINNLALTKDQLDVFNNLKGRLAVSVDKKTQIITLVSTMQDPQISALIADTLTSYLQSYIINYRTQKARQDLIFTEKLYTEAKKDYSDAQEKYARYLDENQNVVMASYRVNQEKLLNETTLAYTVYNQMAQQLQLAKVKVQDTTPVYTIIQPSIIPLLPIKPNKKLIVIGFIFISMIGASVRVIAKDIL